MITPNNKFFKQQWGLYLIKAPQAWTLLNGGSSSLIGNSNEIAFGSSDIRITIVDDGIETKNNLPVSDSFKNNTNNGTLKVIKHIYNENAGSFDFIDLISGSHGMEVSGIVSAKAEINNSIYDGKSIIGVAPNCQILSLTNLNPVFRFVFIFGLAGLEYSSEFWSYANSLNNAYNITNDKLSNFRLQKKIGSIDQGKKLHEFLNGNFTDIFNLSLQINQAPSLISENYSKIFFNELTFLGRNGRGCVIVIGAGNNGLDIEPSPNQFLNEMAYSNKPIIVGAISVDNGYNWLTNSPLPHPKKSSYSNFGNRIDVCAPGGGGTTTGQEYNGIFTTTVRGSGELLNESPSKLTLKSKSIHSSYNNPPESNTHYAIVELEFKNLNGVFVGQNLIIGNFNGINSFEIFKVDSISANKIRISYIKQSTYNSLNTTTIFEFIPLYSKITQVFPNNKKLIEVESIKGAYVGANTYIGTLGDNSSGSNKLISSGGIDILTNQITLTSNVNANVGDYIIFPLKTSKVVNMFSNGTKKIILQNVEGFFIGGKIAIESSSISNPFDAYGVITSIDIATRTLNFSQPLIFSGNLPPSNVDIYAKSIGTGDINTFFNGTSAATPFVSGIAALILSANKFLSSSEVKHIIKESASTTLTVSGSGIPAYSINSDSYQHSPYYGTGLVDAEAAVQLALDWHSNTPSQTIYKPKLIIADRIQSDGIILYNIESNNSDQTVNSPDIWIKPLADISVTIPTFNLPLNTLDTSINQKISIRVRNHGNRQSFKECDLRIFIAFTDDENPAFPFPTMWYEQTNVKLLAVKEIPIIASNSETVIQIEWKDIASQWNSWNPIDTSTGKRKRTYILAHITPFDGIDNDVQRDNIRNNKQLTCKELVVTHKSVNDRTAYLPGNELNITVGNDVITKVFDLTIENILATEINNFKLKATKKNRIDQSLESVFYKKAAVSWELESGTPDWISFEQPIEIVGHHMDYINLKFPHTINVSDDQIEVKLEIVNA